MRNLYKLQFNDLLQQLRSESTAYLFVLFYVFIEYVRPQTLYPSIDVFPFGKIAISLCLISYLLGKKETEIRNNASLLMILFSVVILLSSLLGMSLQISMLYWTDFLNWLLVYYLITKIVNTEERYLLFTLLFLLYTFKMAQFSLRGWVKGGLGYSSQGFGGGPGWFANSGEFGIQMCIYFPIAFYFYRSLKDQWPRWKKLVFVLFPLTGFTGMFSSSNRGTLVGGAAVIIVMFLKSKYKVKALFAIGICLFISLQFIPDAQKERFQNAGEDKTSISRINNWKKGIDMASRNPFLGVGYKNWQIADRTIYDGDGLLPHNIFIQCVSELGYSGLAVFVLLIIVSFNNNRATRKLVTNLDVVDNTFIYNMAHALDASLVGYLVSGFFVTVLFYPFFWVNLSMIVALNNVARRKYGQNNHAR